MTGVSAAKTGARCGRKFRRATGRNNAFRFGKAIASLPSSRRNARGGLKAALPHHRFGASACRFRSSSVIWPARARLESGADSHRAGR
jgi:hypothetical protein